MKILIKMPVLKAKVILILGEIDEVKKEIPYGIDFGSGYLATCRYMRREGVFPFTCVIHSRTAAISVIAHEAVHAANFIMEGMGIVADFDNDELQAYIVQHICHIVEDKTGAYYKTEVNSSDL